MFLNLQKLPGSTKGTAERRGLHPPLALKGAVHASKSKCFACTSHEGQIRKCSGTNAVQQQSYGLSSVRSLTAASSKRNIAGRPKMAECRATQDVTQH